MLYVLVLIMLYDKAPSIVTVPGHLYTKQGCSEAGELWKSENVRLNGYSTLRGFACVPAGDAHRG